MTDFPDIAPPRMPWLITLADLALLLVGFLLLVQVTGDRTALAAGFRRGFGAAPPPAMPLMTNVTEEFATGSAALGHDAALIGWARDALRDPRVTLTVNGAVDGSPGDVDPATRSGAVLAADRARAAAALIGRALPRARLSITTTIVPGRRAATIALAFAGESRSH